MSGIDSHSGRDRTARYLRNTWLRESLDRELISRCDMIEYRHDSRDEDVLRVAERLAAESGVEATQDEEGNIIWNWED